MLFYISLDLCLPYVRSQRYRGRPDLLYFDRVQVIFTLSNTFAARNPIVKLFQLLRAMFKKSLTLDEQESLTKSGSELQPTESIEEQWVPESQGAGATPDTQQLAPTLLV